MISAESMAAKASCPRDEELSAFLRGQLASEQLESIAEHLADCATCADGMEALQVRDGLLLQLRCAPHEAEAANEWAWGELEERARDIPRGQTVTTTVAAANADTVSEGLPLPALFGSYLLLERLGEGGMGVVYKARQESLKRFVALKMIRAGTYAGSEERTRFQREGEVIASLEHPHVVQIHEFGECGGQPYFSMELLSGGTLSRKLAGKPLPEREAAELLRTLARTVAAAHQRGIVHRDLKPANVLFAADGTAKISDFGLAKVLDGDNSDTRSDAILGTPSYMAPEQARGEIRRLGPAADIYALGAILYETLTGRPPFRGESRYQTLEWVRTREPEPPSRRRPHLSRDLEAICLKCLEKEPARRYASADALADDLQRWLDGLPTQARPLSWPRRLCRFTRRRPLGVAVACFLALAAVLPFLVFYFRDPQRKIEDIHKQLRRGETVQLLKNDGMPIWSRWEIGNGTLEASPDDGALLLASVGPALLTLVPDPQRSYRLSAEVRHEFSFKGSEVGLFFAYSKHPTSTGGQHCFGVLSFSDFENGVPNPKNGQLGSRVAFHLHREEENGAGHRNDVPLVYFVPASFQTPKQIPWRSLAVEVRPSGFKLFWENDPPVSFSQRKILEIFDKGKKARVGLRMVPILPELQPEFSPRDALGLFVQHGRASFRNVRVDPLPNP